VKRVAQSRINRKLTVYTVITTCGSLLLTCSIFVIYDVITLRQSMREQLRATTEIAEAVQKMRTLGEGVKRSSEEQRQGSKLITNSVMLMSDRVTQIAEATKAQTASSQAIHQTLKGFSEFTEETDRRAEALREIVSTLSDRSRQLEREIGRFVTE